MNHSYIRFGAVPTGSILNWLYKSETKGLSRDILKVGQDPVGTYRTRYVMRVKCYHKLVPYRYHTPLYPLLHKAHTGTVQ
jgi:hypothetical protein